MKMTLRAAVLFAAGLALTAPAVAQQPGQQRPTREQLMRQIEQRFMAQATQEMALDAEQAERLRSTATEFARERRDLERRERDVKRALQGQLRPGVAADQDSLVVLLDALAENRVAYVASFRSELAAMAEFLDPVQRAQYVMMRERLLEQIRRIQYARQREAGARPNDF